MSDISKKIFSIDPEPDEDPIGDIPPLPEKAKAAIAESDSAGIEADSQTPLRSHIQLRPVDELTNSNIVRSIHASAPHPTPLEPIEEPESIVEPVAVEKAPIVPAADSVTPSATPAPTETGPSPSLVAAVAPRSASRPIVADDPKGHAPAPAPAADFDYGWIGFILTLLTALGISAVLYLLFVQGHTLTSIEMTAIAIAALVPAATIGTLWAALRTLSRVSHRSQRLADIAHRLTHVDDAVATDVSHMAAAIRSELASIDQSLNKTRSQLLTVTEQTAVQSAELTGMTRSAAEQATAIDTAITSHREQFRTLLSDFEIRLQSVERHATLLETTGSDSASRIEIVTQALGHSMASVSKRGQELSDHVQTADTQLKAAEDRLSSLSKRIAKRTAQLDGVYERRAGHLTDLSSRIAQDTESTDSVLTKQSEQLGSIDAQIETTEQRLTALLDHARGIQSQLTARLSDIDSTLSEADRRSRSFTADMSDRINDSIAQTRRELSIMEGELRALQSRMKDQPGLGLDETAANMSNDLPRRIHLQPLDTDLPPVEPEAMDIPEAPDDLLDLVEIIETPEGELTDSPRLIQDDVIRRAGTQDRQIFGQPKRKRTADQSSEGGWSWRDMLGGIDSLDQPADNPTATPPRQTVERPPASVPLSPPASIIQPPSDGSDIVARLCEVQLAPSAIVDEGTIYEAAAMRRANGKDAQNDCVQSRLEGPVLHLREILQDDLEFKLRAESFHRSYAHTLNTIRSEDALQAKLASATGRAYLLCAAALNAA